MDFFVRIWRDLTRGRLNFNKGMLSRSQGSWKSTVRVARGQLQRAQFKAVTMISLSPKANAVQKKNVSRKLETEKNDQEEKHLSSKFQGVVSPVPMQLACMHRRWPQRGLDPGHIFLALTVIFLFIIINYLLLLWSQRVQKSIFHKLQGLRFVF